MNIHSTTTNSNTKAVTRKLTTRELSFTDAFHLCPADVVRVVYDTRDDPLRPVIDPATGKASSVNLSAKLAKDHDTLVVSKTGAFVLVRTLGGDHPLTTYDSLIAYLATLTRKFSHISLNDRAHDPNYPLPFPELRSYHKYNINYE